MKNKDLNNNDYSVAAWIVKFLIKRNVKVVFGLQGGHIQPIWDYCFKLGIRIIDVRERAVNEQLTSEDSLLK